MTSKKDLIKIDEIIKNHALLKSLEELMYKEEFKTGNLKEYFPALWNARQWIIVDVEKSYTTGVR